MTKTVTTNEVAELNAEELSKVSGGEGTMLLASIVLGDKVFYINSAPLPLTNSHVAVAQRT